MLCKLTAMTFKRRKALCDDRGVAAVEFALVAPFFLMMVLGLIDFGRMFWVKSTMQFVVEQSARHAMVNPAITTTLLEDYADTQSANIGLTNATFIATSSSSGGINYMSIRGSYTFTFITPLITSTGVDLAALSKTPVS